LKTLTAITLLPRLNAAFPTMAQTDAPSADGTKAGIVAGTMYKVDDLFTAMLMMSANDAAVALVRRERRGAEDACRDEPGGRQLQRTTRWPAP